MVHCRQVLADVAVVALQVLLGQALHLPGAQFQIHTDMAAPVLTKSLVQWLYVPEQPARVAVTQLMVQPGQQR